MKLIELKIVVRKDGYVKDDDELEIICEDAQRICDNYLHMMKEELVSAGFDVEIK